MSIRMFIVLIKKLNKLLVEELKRPDLSGRFLFFWFCGIVYIHFPRRDFF
jgi:hypothetical protein